MHELLLLATENQVEFICDALLELDAQAVSVEDADADTPAEKALWGEPGMPTVHEAWQRSTIKALFERSEQAMAATTLILAQDWATDVKLLGLQAVDEQDWVRLTQAQFTPVEITPNFWIVPSWHEPPAQAKRIIRLDPGLAFGTGTHPTTRMCLRWIAQQAIGQAHPWQRVLDYGCGSGILAIGAALYEAQQVDATDIDPSAIEATCLNAQANQVTIKTGLPDAIGPAQKAYNLVLANILASPLKILAPILSEHVAPGGHLVLAGILERQAAELQAAYAPWLDLQVVDQDEGWILMSGQALRA